jgi:hypothetical protein
MGMLVRRGMSFENVSLLGMVGFVVATYLMLLVVGSESINQIKSRVNQFFFVEYRNSETHRLRMMSMM